MMCLPGPRSDIFRYQLHIFLMIVGSLLYCDEVYALKLNYGVSQSYETTSNPLYLPIPEDDDRFEDVLTTSSVFLKAKEKTATLKSDVDLKLSYLDYANDISSDLTRKNLKSSFLWVITPSYYSWYLTDNITQSVKDVSLISNDENKQDVNAFTTGPRLQWKIGNSLLKLNSYVSKYSYEETNNDSNNVNSSLTWANSLSSGVKLDVSYATKYVNYDEDQIYGNYDQSTVGVGVKYKKKTNELEAFYGRTFLNSDELSESAFSQRKIKFKRILSRFSSLSLEHSSGLSSKEESLADGDTLLSGLHENLQTSLMYKRAGNVFGGSIKLTDTEKKNIDSGTLDDKQAGSINIYRLMSSRSRLSLLYSQAENDVKISGDQYQSTEIIKKVSYIKLFNNKLSLSVHLSEVNMDSDNFLRRYTDKRAGLTLSIQR